MIIATTFGIGFIVLSAYVYHVLGIHNARHSCSSMKASRSDGIGGVGITLVPNTGEYENVVIWMHGLGDTADGWAQSMPEFTVPKTKYVLPTAPNRPISLNRGMKMPGWSDIRGLDARTPEDKVGFEESRARIERIIAEELSAGIAPNKIVVAGFSQGGALALHTVISCTHCDHPFIDIVVKALRSDVALGGCVALSTWLPFRDEYPAIKTAASDNVRIFQAHGTADNVVHFQWGKSSHEFLKTMCTKPPQFMPIEGMGHSSHPSEIAAVDQFLMSVLS